MRDGKPEGGDDEKEKDKDKKSGDSSGPFNYEKAILPERERPENTPGAVLRVMLDTEHWLASGTDGAIQAIVEGQRVFTPVKLDQGTNVGVFATKDRLVASGLVWDEARDQLAQKAFLVEQPVGDGHIIAFAEDPELSRVRRGHRAALHQRSAAGTGVLVNVAVDGGSLFIAAATASACFITRSTFNPSSFLTSSSDHWRRRSSAVSAGYFDTSSSPCGVTSMPSRSPPRPT